MISFIVSIVYLLIWRLAVLICGIISIILGYKLFKLGFTSQEGQLEAVIGEKKLKISNLAPGIFFALFGASIISILIWTSQPEIIIPKEALKDYGEINLNSGSIRVRGD